MSDFKRASFAFAGDGFKLARTLVLVRSVDEEKQTCCVHDIWLGGKLRGTAYEVPINILVDCSNDETVSAIIEGCKQRYFKDGVLSVSALAPPLPCRPPTIPASWYSKPEDT